jgi:hypothetical protein
MLLPVGTGIVLSTENVAANAENGEALVIGLPRAIVLAYTCIVAKLPTYVGRAPVYVIPIVFEIVL